MRKRYLGLMLLCAVMGSIAVAQDDGGKRMARGKSSASGDGGAGATASVSDTKSVASSRGSKGAGQKGVSGAEADVEGAEEFRPRLPRYFSGLVDAGQREAIYAIQRRYHERIAALMRQLEDLERQQMDEVRGVLTEEQRGRLTELEAAARKARVARTSAGKTAGRPKATPSRKPSRSKLGDVSTDG